MSQSIEVVGCRVADRPNGELWDDQPSLDAYIQLQSIQCFQLPISLHSNIRAKYLDFTKKLNKERKKKRNPKVIHFNLIDCRRHSALIQSDLHTWGSDRPH